VRVAAQCIDADLDSFVAVDVLILLDRLVELSGIEPLTSSGVGAASGGALGLGANAVTSGGQIELKPESLLRFRIAAPLTTTVYQQNGVQLTLPPAAGPAVKPQQPVG
jgi:hypothetical protein